MTTPPTRPDNWQNSQERWNGLPVEVKELMQRTVNAELDLTLADAKVEYLKAALESIWECLRPGACDCAPDDPTCGLKDEVNEAVRIAERVLERVRREG